jgi:hypothetical protein
MKKTSELVGKVSDDEYMMESSTGRSFGCLARGLLYSFICIRVVVHSQGLILIFVLVWQFGVILDLQLMEQPESSQLLFGCHHKRWYGNLLMQVVRLPGSMESTQYWNGNH